MRNNAMKTLSLICLGSLLLIVLPAYASGVYKWVDENGKVHYSDQKPEDPAVEVKQLNVSSIEIDEQGNVAPTGNAIEESAGEITGEAAAMAGDLADVAGVSEESVEQVSGWLENIISEVMAFVNSLLSEADQVAGKVTEQVEDTLPGGNNDVITNEDIDRILSEPSPASRQNQGSEPKVELFTTVWCGYCKTARAYLQANKIPFKEHDIERSAAAALRQKRMGGGSGVPFAIINGKTIRGWNAAAYKQALGL
jgi:glutaredoxin